ncbi:MAG: TraX family protein [Oscillospiraceae bacterium]|nr:TraX family protein [Oscillospiraceae bacterium]
MTIAARGKFQCLSSSTLKIIAMALMLCDHMWATVVPGALWLTCLGRLAFPIFAFQIADGYAKTSNFRRYLGRMVIFALVSEIPFNFMMAGSWIYPFDQNAMFTFVIALLMLRLVDKARARCKTPVYALCAVLICALGYLLGTLFFVDFKGVGVLLVLIFYIFRDVPLGRLWELLIIGYFFLYAMEGQCIPLTVLGRELFFPVQGFGVLALPLIWLYNGEKGIGGKVFRYIGYGFYPVHIAILAFLYLNR